MSRKVKCTMCSESVAIDDPVNFFRHVHWSHENSKMFYVICKFPGCNHQYHVFSSFKRHWNKQHGSRVPFQETNVGSQQTVNYDEHQTILHEDGSHVLDKEINDEFQPMVTFVEDQTTLNEESYQANELMNEIVNITEQSKRNSEKASTFNPATLREAEWEAGILLTLRQRYFLPFEALLYVSEAINSFYDNKVIAIQGKLQKLLSDSVIDSLPFQKIFQHLEEDEQLTRHRLEAKWNNYFPAVMPVPVILNKDQPSYEWVKNNESGFILDEVFETGYIVPFLASLQQHLSIKVFYEAVLQNFENNGSSHQDSGEYGDVWDGSFAKQLPLYIEMNGRILLFQIYMDDVELANPLGSKKGKHKVSIFYALPLNLPPRLRSSLRSIMLIGIVGSELLKQRGVETFLAPFFKDILLLQKGVEFTVRNIRSKWYGAVLNFAGDMPASNFVGGFKEGVSFASYPCRSCMIHRADLDRIHHEVDCPAIRDRASHDRQVEEIENQNQTKSARDALSALYGINSRCSFSVLNYFDPTKCFMHDLMHIANEGVLNSGAALLLKNLILDVHIKLNLLDLNYEIANLNCERDFTTPPPIRLDEVMGSTKLSFSSSEMASLAMCLPLVLSQFVTADDNPFYANFLLLLEILASLQCYSFTETDLRILGKNIEIHNANFVILYPSEKENVSAITPKLHMLLHFPNQIRRFGAPRYSWCFRYESKNAPFKKIMKRNCNFHNVPWSLSCHHQKLVGLDVRTDGEGDYFGMSDNVKIISMLNRKPSIDVSCSNWSQLLCQNTELVEDSKIRLIKTVKIAGRICSKGAVFLLKAECSEKQPQFFRIADIIISDLGMYLVMENMATLFFCRDRFSFIVQPQKCFTVVDSESLEFVTPLHSFHFDNELHVIPNYYHLL